MLAFIATQNAFLLENIWK